MLVLERNSEQSIVIFPSESIDPNMTIAELFAGGHIEIKILEAKSKVKLGIQAPVGLKIMRTELGRTKLG